MYESIRGTLLRREPAVAVVEAAGLAYRVHVPLSTSEGLPPPGSEVILCLHLAVREDEWRLYGFAREAERSVFQSLLRVNGVGPVMALSLLSGFRPDEFRNAVGQGDVKALTRVKGVGKKTAERIIVELRDAVGAIDPLELAGGGAESGPRQDAVRALESLGLDPAEAAKRVAKHAADAGDELDTSELIRKALRG
ncbi:MAG: Holliday junction branch migration protein RuvA, partial [Planctomycetota bacterium]|nr:Holliday junction branch migration protein RuvA [Planctomycetota bacterium]